jgi:hypothetical protein
MPTSTNAGIDIDQVSKFCRAIFEPGDRIEIRILPADRGGRAVCIHKAAGQVAELAELFDAHNNPLWQGIYITLNPLRAARGSGHHGMAQDQDVLHARCLFVDFDDATPEQAGERIRQAGLPVPTFLVASGRATGTHAYWHFCEPLADLAVWRGLQRQLIHLLRSDRSIVNPSRIMRCPGTFNHTRRNACRVVSEGPSYAAWTELGIEPRTESATTPSENGHVAGGPNRAGLNSHTREYLTISRVPEGGNGTRFAGRNMALFAACMDYRANGFSIETAQTELVERCAIQRDGLDAHEAAITLRNAYRRQAQPSTPRRESPTSVAQAIDANQSFPPRLEEEQREGVPLPTIWFQDGRHLREQVANSITALVTANAREPRTFVSGGELARVKPTAEGRWIIEQLGVDALRGVLGRVANFMVPPRRRDDAPMPIAPPMDIVRDIASLPTWPGIPPLIGIVTSPRIRRDGSVLCEPGYDPLTGLFLAYDGELISMPVCPTKNNASEAARFIAEELLGDFPFVSPADCANAIGFAISMVARPAIAGAIPVAVFDARSGQGSGKSLTARSLCFVAGGCEPPMSAIPNEEAEMRKTLTAALMRGGDVLIFDNATEPIESGTFANAVTSPVFEDRVLGASRRVELPVRCCWAITGNRVGLGGDMARRCYPIELDAACERPEDRAGFRHPDLIGWVRENRPALLRALLVMCRAWWAAGCPASAGLKPWGSFEEFTRVVGGILAHAGVEGFLANRQTFRDGADDSRHEWAEFLAALHACFGGRVFTTKDVVNEAERFGGDFAASLPGDLHDAFERRRGFAKRLGIALAKGAGRIFDGHRLSTERDSHTKVRTFRVALADPRGAASAGSAGNCGELSNSPTRGLFSS